MSEAGDRAFDPDGPDDGLWAAFVEGEEGAFEVLVRRYSPDLFWYLLLSTGRQRTAGQHLVRTWQLVARYRRPFDGFESFRGWLYAVATQNAVPADHPEAMGLTELLDDLTRGGGSDRRAEIFFRLTELRRHLRQPFLLVTVAGLGLREAACACNFTVAQTQKYVEKACRRLARCRVFASAEADDEV